MSTSTNQSAATVLQQHFAGRAWYLVVLDHKLWLFCAQGGNVTSGLKKVSDDMKTKNRADRTGAVPSSAPSSSAATSKGAFPFIHYSFSPRV